MTPNQIIAALLDIASAAFEVQHGANHTGRMLDEVNAEDLEKLEKAIGKLDQLPQPTDQPPLTPTAKARHAMASFLGGEPVRVNVTPTAAQVLTDLSVQYGMHQRFAEIPLFNEGDPITRKMIQQKRDELRGFGNPTDAEINEITQINLGKWPTFEAQSWACKVVHAVADKLRREDMRTIRDKLLADTATEAHRIYNDADLLEQLRRMCGYVENGSSEYITIGQDDATNEWSVSVGYSTDRRRRYHANSFHQALRLAVDGEIENETCKFCGFDVEFPCDAPPADVCSTAMRAADRAERLKAPASKPAKVTPREAMEKALNELATKYSNTSAKRIIIQVGGVQKMKDIPDNKVAAVMLGARDRIILEKRLAERRASGDKLGEMEIEEALRASDGTQPYHTGGVIPPGTFPLPEPIIVPPQEFLDTPEPPQAEEPKDSGGAFDGGGASGDY